MIEGFHLLRLLLTIEVDGPLRRDYFIGLFEEHHGVLFIVLLLRDHQLSDLLLVLGLLLRLADEALRIVVMI